VVDAGKLRYSRQLALPPIGDAGQPTLAEARVLIVGLGGLGSPVSLYLAAAGVGTLVLNDFDQVDESNLPRQILFRDDDIGARKAEAAAARLRSVNPGAQLEVLDQRLNDEELTAAARDCDVVLDCSDNFATRSQINRACILSAKPLVSGAAIRLEGQVALFRHDLSGQPCYNCLYPEEDELLENCAGQGILGPVAGTIGSLMATETIKRICELPSELAGKVWLYDGLAGHSRSLRLRRRHNCEACALARRD